MSEYVTYKGELKEVYSNLKGLDEKIIQIFKDEDIKMDEYIYKDLVGAFYYYDLEEGYVLLGYNVYKITKNENLGEDIFHMSKNEDGTLSYVVSYYNGGCDLSEAIDEAHKRMHQTRA